MTKTKEEELKAKIVELMKMEYHHHLDIEMTEDDAFIDSSEFSKDCKSCLEIQELRAELKGIQEGKSQAINEFKKKLKEAFYKEMSYKDFYEVLNKTAQEMNNGKTI